jgi:hypothetical protein
MALITNIVPLRFYQVRQSEDGLSLNDISARLRVNPSDIERENKTSPDVPLVSGEMLFIRNF